MKLKYKLLFGCLTVLVLAVLVQAYSLSSLGDVNVQGDMNVTGTLNMNATGSIIGAADVNATRFYGDGTGLTGVSTGTNLTEIELYFVNRTDWTTIDDYPSACGANTYVTAIGDTLTCDAVTSFAYSDWFNQFLNTTDAPVFAGLNSTGNISVGDGASAFTMQPNGSNVLFDSGTDYDIVSSVNITAPYLILTQATILSANTTEIICTPGTIYYDADDTLFYGCNGTWQQLN